MADHLALGRLGEKLAAAYLLTKGFTILHQNWKYERLEVDIIAEKDSTIHFIEVKTRRSTKFGYPEEDVTTKKLANVIDAASEFQYQHPECTMIQFDILSILLDKDGSEEYFFIEDVYF